MIETTYKCDKCSSEQNSPEQFWTIGVGFSSTNCSPSIGLKSRIHVCRKCLAGFGLVTEKSVTQPSPLPTTEDLIIEVLGRCGIYPSE